MSAIPVAKLLGADGKWLFAMCPFCRIAHRHVRTSMGSSAIVAECSKHGDLRVYSIPADRKPTKRNR